MKQGGAAAEDETWVELAFAILAVHSTNRFADGLMLPPDFQDERANVRPYLPLISEPEADDRVKEVYQEIKGFYQMDRVPNVYRAMALNPGYLSDIWAFNKLAFQDAKLSRRDKELVALAVSAAAYSPYGLDFHMREVRRLGADDGMIYEVMAIVHQFSGLTKFADCLQLEPDMLPRKL